MGGGAGEGIVQLRWAGVEEPGENLLRSGRYRVCTDEGTDMAP